MRLFRRAKEQLRLERWRPRARGCRNALERKKFLSLAQHEPPAAGARLGESGRVRGAAHARVGCADSHAERALGSDGHSVGRWLGDEGCGGEGDEECVQISQKLGLHMAGEGPRQLASICVDELRQVAQPAGGKRSLGRPVDAGQVRQLRPVEKAPLAHHLREVHCAERRVQPAGIGRDVNHCLQHAERLVKDRLQVGHVVRHGERCPRKVGLEQQLRLDMGRVERALVDGPGQGAGQRRVHMLLVVPDGKLDAEQLGQRDGRLVDVVQLGVEQGDGSVLQVVVRGHLAERERLHPKPIGRQPHAASRLEVSERRLDKGRQVPVEAVVRRFGAVVVGRILEEAAIKVGPGQEVDRVLLRPDRAAHHLSIDVVVQLLVQAGLDREGLVQEFLIKRLLGLVDQDDGDRLVVVLRPAGTAHHLQHVSHREVDIPLGLAIEVLGALDNDQVGREVDAPRERRGADKHEDCLSQEEPLNQHAVGLLEPRMVDPDAEGERVTERRVAHAGQLGLEVGQRYRQELRLAFVGRAIGDQVERHKDEGGLARRVDGDGAVRRLVHRGHARAVVLTGEAGDVHLKRDWPDRRLEVKDGVVRNAEPIGQVGGVSHRGGEPDDAYGRAHPLGHVPHARDDHLEDGAALLP
eukprot:scaffold11940_cov106-Isochrysis_galbana.AAC.9